MNRRAWLLQVGGGIAVARMAQDSAQSTGAADPLNDPSSVGTLRSETQAADNDAVIVAVERRLKCTCGCNLDIFTCRTTDFACTYSPALHREVVALYQAGTSPDGIVEAFVAKYGEVALLAPRTRGFNLLGYLLPGAAIVAAASGLTFILLRRHRAKLALADTRLPPQPAAAGSALSEQDRALLNRALEEVEP